MSIISNILDALRRRGTATQRSALARQDEYTADKTVVARERRWIRGPNGMTAGFVATIEPIPEVVTPVDGDDLAAILANASLAIDFIARFTSSTDAPPSLQAIDDAFASWLQSDDRQGYSEDAVIELLGAAFGEYCARMLNMRWIRVEDQDGTAIAIEGITHKFRCFPYHSITKRLGSGEFGFFAGVYALLEAMVHEVAPHSDGAGVSS